jgi:hypothetical protein
MVAHAKAADPNVLDDINVDDIFAVLDGVKQGTAKAKASRHISNTWCGQTRSRWKVGSDIPPEWNRTTEQRAQFLALVTWLRSQEAKKLVADWAPFIPNPKC